MKGLTFMPRYELMYLLSGQITDSEQPAVTQAIQTAVENFGGHDLEQEDLGKKKLAYPIKKTKNGFYGIFRFTMPGEQIAKLDAKLRTMTQTIIRFLLINIDNHLTRSAKDAKNQASLPKRQEEETSETDPGKPQDTAPQTDLMEEVEASETKTSEPKFDLDAQIEDALKQPNL